MPSLTDNPKRLIDPDSVRVVAELKACKDGKDDFHAVSVSGIGCGYLMSAWGTVAKVEWYTGSSSGRHRAFVAIRHGHDPSIATMHVDEVQIEYDPQLTEKAIRTN